MTKDTSARYPAKQSETCEETLASICNPDRMVSAAAKHNLETTKVEQEPTFTVNQSLDSLGTCACSTSENFVIDGMERLGRA